VVSAPPLVELLGRNACLFAGAGAGKTHGLLTAALGRLAGAGEAEPVPPGGLCLLTFTEKAAAEMRERLEARVEALAEGRGEEPELEAALAAAGRPPPGSAFWRQVHATLGAATLSTFHAYCARLLRQAPPGTGIAPGFELLAEDDARELLVDTAEQTMLGLLDAGDAQVEALCAQADLRGMGRGSGLLEWLVAGVEHLREEGRRGSGLPVGELAAAAELVSRAVERARGLVERTLPPVRREAAESGEVLAACLDALHGFDGGAPPERAARLEALALALPGPGRNGVRDALRAVREALLEGTPAEPGVVSAHAGVAALPHQRTLRRLCDRVMADHRAALRRGGWMDFAELMVAARDLLRDDPTFRSTAQARIGTLLVDEVQDTNGLQLELLLLLAEAREGAPRPLAPERAAVLALPLEPRFLLAVGDRKQSIYDFRGADVAVFEQLARKVEAEGGARHYLRENRRSQPALLHVLNAAAAAALPAVAAPRDYEVSFHPEEDSLLPVRAQVGPPACVDLLPAPAGRGREGRAEEGDVLARWLRHLLSPEGPPSVAEGGVLRRARGGDVAILLRGFTGLDNYLEALRAQGVPHRVLRDRNPYTAPGVVDAAALLGMLDDPGDALRLAAALRSPFVGLSDASLLRLAESGRLEGRALIEPIPEAMPEDEALRFRRFRALFASLVRFQGLLPLAALLEVAWGETGYRTAVAAGPEADEGMDSLDRLLELARSWDASGRGGAGAFGRRLDALAEHAAVGLATGVEQARASGAVQVLSIHAAKGLQWPVVCLADLGVTGFRAPNDRLLLDRSLGLAWKPQGPFDAEPRRTPRWLELRAELERRDRAEAGRILYVGLTRAQDRLVLSGGSGLADAWRARLEQALDRPDLVTSVRRVALEDVPPGVPPGSAPPEPRADAERASSLLASLRARPQPRWESVPLAAARLEDARRCPRREMLLHQLGLAPEGEEVAGVPWAAALGPRHRGARVELLGALAGALSASDWAAGASDEVLRPHLVVRGLSLGEARALGLLEPLQRLARTEGIRAAAASGTLRGGVELALDLGEVQSLVRAPLCWEEAFGLHVLLLLPGKPPMSLDSWAVTTSVALHALEPFGARARVGLSFLGDGGQEPHWIESAPLSREALAEEARRLLGRAREEAAGRPHATCVALGCGFVGRCHPSPPGL
jgi:ATP-dependent helicase/nuclease subunit A